MPRILLVEDDASIARAVRAALERRGFELHVASRVAEVPSDVAGYELVLLDLMLPDGYGLDVLRSLRRGSGPSGSIPVIILTARDATHDKVRGLELGADDYLTKPFHPDELLARIGARLRRSMSAEVIEVGSLRLEPSEERVAEGPVVLELTRVERAILFTLARRGGRPVARSELAETVLDRTDDPAAERALDVHISRLRKKLGSHGDRIRTVWGIGYRFDLGEAL